MGTDTGADLQLFYKQGDEWVPAKVGLFSLEDAEREYTQTMFETEIMITGSFKTVKRLRCKSRKRLIKLLMSIGYGRNDAVSIAKEYHDLGVSYWIAWLMYCF